MGEKERRGNPSVAQGQVRLLQQRRNRDLLRRRGHEGDGSRHRQRSEGKVMIAVDTNLLIRLLTNDDPLEAKRALRVMENDDIFIPKTVLIETQRVLRHG